MKNYDSVINSEDVPTKLYVDSKLDQATADGRYVNVTGDETKTGSLTVDGMRLGISSGYGANYRSIETSGLPGGGHFLFGVQSGGDRTAYLQSNEGSVVIRPASDPAAQLEVQSSVVVANKPVMLPADPSVALHAATKQYVDQRRMAQVAVVSAAPTLSAVVGIDYIYICTAAMSIALPTAVGNRSTYTFKRTGTENVTITTTSGQTIDAATTFVLDVRWVSISVISDGANWVVI